MNAEIIEQAKKVDGFNINDLFVQCLEVNDWSGVSLLLQEGLDLRTIHNGRANIFYLFEKCKDEKFAKSYSSIGGKKYALGENYVSTGLLSVIESVIDKDPEILTQKLQSNKVGGVVAEKLPFMYLIQHCTDSYLNMIIDHYELIPRSYTPSCLEKKTNILD